MSFSLQKIWLPSLFLAALGGGLLLAFSGTDATLAFLVGGTMLALSFQLHVWAWDLYNQNKTKKLIAFAVPLIVIKYVLFGVIIYWVTNIQKWNPVYFCLGVGAFVLAIVLQPLWMKKANLEA